MSDDKPAGDTDTEAEEEQSSRIAGGCVLLILAVVAVLVLRVVVTVAPYSAYFVAGVLVCLAWQRVRAWARGRSEGEGAADEDVPDVAEALRYLSRGGDHVLLTQLQKYLRAADTKAVRKLLKAEKIRVRDGVRTPKGNGPGVHQEDIPAPPPVEATPSESGCSCRPEPTTPTPTTGTTVSPIGLAGMVVKDGSEAARRHRIA